jgi:nucleoside 2-deoxyribosyltransferase
MRIFFAGPLTNLQNPEATKKWYRDMAGIANKNGFECFWAFLSGTDPVKDPGVDPDYIYEKDLRELGKSNIMIAYIGEPSTGTGQELEYAKEHDIPIYLVYEKNKPVSRMVIGNPEVKGVIEFTDFDDALSQLDKLLASINQRITLTA